MRPSIAKEMKMTSDIGYWYTQGHTLYFEYDGNHTQYRAITSYLRVGKNFVELYP